MLPNNRTFSGKEFVEADGRIYRRSFKIEKLGRFRCVIQILEIHSEYRQGIAFALSQKPEFKGKVCINGQLWKPDQGKRTAYVIPVAQTEKMDRIELDLDIWQGYFRLANASDFLDDYPDLIEKISAQTGRTREQFRGCSYTSGFTAANMYGNAFWIETISDNQYRFHCNDHKMDEDFDDLIFDLEIIEADDFR